MFQKMFFFNETGHFYLPDLPPMVVVMVIPTLVEAPSAARACARHHPHRPQPLRVVN